MATRKSTSDQRAIQRKIDSKAAKSGGGAKGKKQPVQAGARKQPENPLPPQHLRKPGYEHELKPRPRYLAPDYRGSGKLEGMAAIAAAS